MSLARADPGADQSVHGGDITLGVIGRAGVVTLNRPRALNALTSAMVGAMTGALDAWRNDPSVLMVVIRSSNPRAFCAGGDVRELHAKVEAGDLVGARAHCHAEYRLDGLIASYPKPVVALMQGLVMGGGIGISAHARHAVATQSTVVSTPECSVGLIPDSGSTHLLARAPSHLGEYCGLTGARLTGAEVVRAGFANHLVPNACVQELETRLLESGDPGILGQYDTGVGEATMPEGHEHIPEIFALHSAARIFEALEALPPSRWRQATLTQISRASPLAIEAALRAIRLARRTPGLANALVREYRVNCRLIAGGDFMEGVRAVVRDKDRNPQWLFSRLSAVPAELLEQLFQTPPDGDLVI